MVRRMFGNGSWGRATRRRGVVKIRVAWCRRGRGRRRLRDGNYEFFMMVFEMTGSYSTVLRRRSAAGLENAPGRAESTSRRQLQTPHDDTTIRTGLGRVAKRRGGYRYGKQFLWSIVIITHAPRRHLVWPRVPPQRPHHVSSPLRVSTRRSNIRDSSATMFYLRS